MSSTLSPNPNPNPNSDPKPGQAPTPVPGNREPAMEKALEETRQPITPDSPVVDPGQAPAP